MICRECKKGVETPLLMYDGRVFCPHCHKELTNIGSFKVTRSNENEYQLARAGYFGWLENPVEANKVVLKQSIEHCVNAANDGNPKAVKLLAFFYENGYEEEARSKSERYVIALNYYKNVCFSGKIEIENGISGYSDDANVRLRRECAFRLLELSSALCGLGIGIEKQKWQKMRRRLAGQIRETSLLSGEELSAAEASLGTDFKQDRIESAYAILSSCLGSGRTPLMGIIKLTNEELSELYFRSNAQEKRTLYNMIKSGLRFWHVSCPASGQIAEDAAFMPLRGDARGNEEYIAELSGNSSGWGYLFFFNPVGRHPYLRRGDLKKLLGEFEKGYGELTPVRELVNRGNRSDITFFDDDIVVMRGKGRSLKEALMRLVEDAVGEI